MAIAPDHTVANVHWMAIRIRLRHTPRHGIPINCGAASICDSIEYKWETAVRIRVISRYGVAGCSVEWSWC